MSQGFKSLAPLAAQAADKKKGEDVLLLDVHRHSGLSDFMLLVNVTSPAHMEAVENEIEETMETAGVPLIHRDGSDSALWRVLDYGGLLVHLMHPQAREFYALEKLYHDAPRRHWRVETHPEAHPPLSEPRRAQTKRPFASRAKLRNA